MKLIYSMALMAIIFSFSGCSTIDVSSDYDPSAQLKGLKTYAWELDKPVTGNPRLDNPLLHEKIRYAVDQELAAKGYQRVSSGEDFEVAYSVGLKDKLDVTTFDHYGYTYPAGFGSHGGFRGGHLAAMPQTQTHVYQYEEGTLLIDFVNPKTEQLMWRGTATAAVEPKESQEEKTERIRKAVHKVLNQFPPKRTR